MTPQRLARLRATLARRQPDLTVLMDNVRKAHNFSAVLRSCDAVGVHEVHGVWPSAEERPQGATSSGAHRWLSLTLHDDIATAVAHLRARAFAVIATGVTNECLDYRQIDYTQPTAIVLGAERDGISAAVREHADAQISIPMHGMTESLNLSVAAGIILYEAQRQRSAAGMYREPRLDERSYQRSLFEWAHPQVAEYCRAHAIEYPMLDDDGLIIGPIDGIRSKS